MQKLIAPAHGFPIALTIPKALSRQENAPKFAYPWGMKDEKGELHALTEKIIGAVLAVHREIGPGTLESTCEACLTFELIDRGLVVERQKARRLQGWSFNQLQC